MDHLPKCVILETPLSDAADLPGFVERCLADGVLFVAIRGGNAVCVEKEVDWLAIGDGSNPERFLTTAAFELEPLADVVDIAKLWDGGGGDYAIVNL